MNLFIRCNTDFPESHLTMSSSEKSPPSPKEQFGTKLTEAIEGARAQEDRKTVIPSEINKFYLKNDPRYSSDLSVYSDIPEDKNHMWFALKLYEFCDCGHVSLRKVQDWTDGKHFPPHEYLPYFPPILGISLDNLFEVEVTIGAAPPLNEANVDANQKQLHPFSEIEMKPLLWIPNDTYAPRRNALIMTAQTSVWIAVRTGDSIKWTDGDAEGMLENILLAGINLRFLLLDKDYKIGKEMINQRRKKQTSDLKKINTDLDRTIGKLGDIVERLYPSSSQPEPSILAKTQKQRKEASNRLHVRIISHAVNANLTLIDPSPDNPNGYPIHALALYFNYQADHTHSPLMDVHTVNGTSNDIQLARFFQGEYIRLWESGRDIDVRDRKIDASED